MRTEFTGRQVIVTRKLKLQAEAGLERIERILSGGATGGGKAAASASAHVVLAAEKYRQTAEVTFKTRHLEVVGLCEATVMETALHDALAKAEKQVLKHLSRLRAQKRKPKAEKVTAEAVSPRGRKSGSRTLAEAEIGGEDISQKGAARRSEAGARNGAAARNGSNGASQATIPVLVHSFPAKILVQEPHIVRSRDSVAIRPMSLEEAVKEAEFRDREVFVFRDKNGSVMVLHRKKDGKMELIEAPM